MTQLKQNLENNRTKNSFRVAITLSILAILISIFALKFISGKSKTTHYNSNIENSLSTIKSENKLKVGYGGFPPYTIVNPGENDPNLQVTGYSVDLIKEIAQLSDPPLEIEWVRFNWETIQPELQSGKFDLIADPVYQTVPRALEFGFSDPYAYFGIAVAIVRIDDDRFESFQDFNREDITISLAKGWTSSEYARRYLTKPKFNEIPVTGDAFNQLDDVMLGRVDVAINDVPTVVQYAKANSDKVKAILIENPPSSVPGGFVTRQNDVQLINFLNSSLDILQANGILETLDKKWETYHYIPRTSLIPGTGLKN